MSAAQQRNWFLAAALGITAVLVIFGSPARRVDGPPVVKKIKARAAASPQPLTIEGRVAPAVTAAIPVPTEKMRMVARLNEPLAAGAVVGTTPGDAGSVASVAVRAPAHGILVEPVRGHLGIAPDPSVLSAHATIRAGDLARVREGQRAEVAVKGQAGPPLRGTVKTIGEVDGATGAFPVEIAIQGSRERMFSPMAASIRLLPD